MVDGTNTITLGHGDLDEAINTPAGAPRVTDEPVVKTRVGVIAVADDGDGVVGGNTTGSGVKNTTSVVVEDTGSGIDGNGDGLESNCSLHVGGVVSNADVGVKSDIRGLRLVVGALTVCGKVGPVSLQVSLVALEVSVGIVGHSTSATVVGGDTSDKLLLSERNKFVTSDGVGTLNGASGGESPA